MIEIVIVVAIAFMLLARKGKGRRRMGRYIRGNVDETLALTTLASRTLISANFDDTVTERTLLSSIVASWSLSGMTAGDNIGPVLMGVAHSDYSSAEIEAWVENFQGWQEGDQIAREVGQRKVRIAGQLGSPASVGETEVLNNGNKLKMKLNWILNAGDTLKLWAYNLGSAAIATTVPDIHVEGHVNLWPR